MAQFCMAKNLKWLASTLSSLAIKDGLNDGVKLRTSKMVGGFGSGASVQIAQTSPDA